MTSPTQTVDLTLLTVATVAQWLQDHGYRVIAKTASVAAPGAIGVIFQKYGPDGGMPTVQMASAGDTLTWSGDRVVVSRTVTA